MPEDYTKHIATLLKHPLTLILAGIGGFLFFKYSPEENWIGLLVGLLCTFTGVGAIFDGSKPDIKRWWQIRTKRKAIKEELKSLTHLEDQILKVMVSHNMRKLRSGDLKDKSLVSQETQPPSLAKFHPNDSRRNKVSFETKLFNEIFSLEDKKLGTESSSGFGGHWVFSVPDLVWKELKSHYKNHFNTRTETFAEFEKQHNDN